MIDGLISSASALLLVDVLRVVAAAMCLAVTAAALYLAMQPGREPGRRRQRLPRLAQRGPAGGLRHAGRPVQFRGVPR